MLPLDTPARLVLPRPISTNNLFRNLSGGKGGRVITKDYRAWKALAAEYLGAQRPLPSFGVAVEITLYVGETSLGQMDSDNTQKAYIDALVAAKVIVDDRRKWLRSTSAIWTTGMAGCVAVIEPAVPCDGADIIATIRPGLRSLLDR